MPATRSNDRTSLVSFSGVDGAGKSTQIEALCSRLRQDGVDVRVIRFWDDIAQLTQFRVSAGHTIFKGDKGVGTPSAPINRRDKNVRSWPMSALRGFLYLVDAVATRSAVKHALRSGADLVIFDRYMYDELANLPVSSPWGQSYIRLIMKLVPRPNISFLLDASPEKARARKPEYPLEFLRINRKSYMDMVDVIGGITVIDALPLAAVTEAIVSCILSELPLHGHTCESKGVRLSGESPTTG
jgi:thymidylate kinase